MSPFNVASHPLIEITISRTTLQRRLAIIPLGLLLLLGVMGATVGPRINGPTAAYPEIPVISA